MVIKFSAPVRRARLTISKLLANSFFYLFFFHVVDFKLNNELIIMETCLKRVDDNHL